MGNFRQSLKTTSDRKAFYELEIYLGAMSLNITIYIGFNIKRLKLIIRSLQTQTHRISFS